MDVILMQTNPRVDGTSTLPAYEKYIELQSFGHGPIPQGKADNQEFTITKNVDAATPGLGSVFVKGEKFKSVELVVGRSDKNKVTTLITYQLTDVALGSVAIVAAKLENNKFIPGVETVTMKCGNITVQYGSKY
ncbi:MAG TPA: type VI secretion system tube protein Hcp [Pyrinomonadaceae bacterium]|nr:type VI secretion system tube protein Hcp [Pyrinomonadaceae bacterium]